MKIARPGASMLSAIRYEAAIPAGVADEEMPVGVRVERDLAARTDHVDDVAGLAPAGPTCCRVLRDRR